MPDEQTTDAINQEIKSSLEKLNVRTGLLRAEIDRIRTRIDKFSSQDLLSSIGAAQTLLNNARLKQRDIDFLFNLVERVRNESDAAAEQAAQVFQNASRILATLERFDRVVSEGKQRVKEAEELRPLIEANRAASRESTSALQAKLANLKSKVKNKEEKALVLN